MVANFLLTKKLNKATILKQKLLTLFSQSSTYNLSGLMGPSKYNITTSPNYKFVWFRVAKVGTRTILGVLDKNPKVKATYFSNCSFHSKSYTDYFKFAFVRDPVSRFKSAWANKIYDSNYFNLSNQKLEKLRDINYFIEMIHGQGDYLSHVISKGKHFLLQSSLIDLNNIDFIGRMESFEKERYAHCT